MWVATALLAGCQPESVERDTSADLVALTAPFAASTTTRRDAAQLAEVAVEGDPASEALVESGDYAISFEVRSDGEAGERVRYEVTPLAVAANWYHDDAREHPRPNALSSAILDERLLNPSDDPNEVINVVVQIDAPSEDPVASTLARRRGYTSATDTDARLQRELEIARRFDQFATRVVPHLEALASATGAEMLEAYAVAGAALFRIRRADIQELARLPGVLRVEPNAALEQASIDAWQAARAAQIDQYIIAGNDGGRPNPTRHSRPHITLGVVDATFEDDWESIGDARISERWNCYTSPCTSTSELDATLLAPAPPLNIDTRHGTACAQIASGQAPLPYSYADPRSGASRAATFVLATAITTDHYLRAIDRFAQSTVDIVSSSLMGYDGCATSTTLATAVNNLARVYGVSWFQCAGNEGHSSPTSCTLRDPAGATYAFVAGGLLDQAVVQSSTSDYTSIQSGPIYSFSGRGRVPYLLGTRSVIGAAAVASQTLLPEDMPNYYTYIAIGTSFATPLLAGAAVDIRDWWLGNAAALGYGTGFVNDPGFTYVQMLLMGDRQTEGGTRTHIGFDSLFGSGRFRARMFNSAGMDDPWAARISAFYVNAGQTTTYQINSGQPLPTGVDRLSVAMWWPEPDYVNGADIIMTVRTTCGASSSSVDLSFDNKKRVYIDASDGPVAGRCWAVDVTSYAAPPNPWDSNQSRRYVYLGYYFEDEARDDLWVGVQ